MEDGSSTLPSATFFFGLKYIFEPQSPSDDRIDYCHLPFLASYFHLNTFKLGYLSYRYFTDGGGVRFRKVIQEKNVNSMFFLDFENYKAPKSADLDSLPYYFHTQKLSLLSRIENENIQVSVLE